MSITKAKLKNSILTMLNISAGVDSYYTDDKIDDLINESLDYVAVEMMMTSEGWLSNIVYIDTVAGTNSYKIPASCAIINSVRYLSGDIYYPLQYDEASEANQLDTTSATTAFPTTYRIMGSNIYFNPAPAEGGTRYLQLEYSAYPQELINDGQNFSSQIDRAMLNFVKWRVIKMLTATRRDLYPDFISHYNEWYDQMMKVINKRVRSKQFVGEFQG